MGKLILERLFVVYVACNMLVCAVLLLPWALPRETLSGFVGRHAFHGCRWAVALSRGIDSIFAHDECHCQNVFLDETAARRELYDY